MCGSFASSTSVMTSLVSNLLLWPVPSSHLRVRECFGFNCSLGQGLRVVIRLCRGFNGPVCVLQMRHQRRHACGENMEHLNARCPDDSTLTSPIAKYHSTEIVFMAMHPHFVAGRPRSARSSKDYRLTIFSLIICFTYKTLLRLF